jgi:hypothetical protein
VYWLQRPPLLRRIGAVALLAIAVVWDLRGGSGSTPYPVAAAPIPAGTEITRDLITWVDIPATALAPNDPIGSVAAVSVNRGEPLTASLLAGPVEAPDGWWTVPVEIGTIAAPGDDVLLVVADPPLSVIGIVVEGQVGDPYDLTHRPAAVAVPSEAAPLIAAAEQAGLLVTAVRGGTSGR